MGGAWPFFIAGLDLSGYFVNERVLSAFLSDTLLVENCWYWSPPQEHSDETKMFWQSIFRHKLAWTMKQHDVSPARGINADETCVRLLPANTNGWSQVGRKRARFANRRQPSLAHSRSPWMPRLHCICSSFTRAERTRAGRIKTAYPTRSAWTHSVGHQKTL